MLEAVTAGREVEEALGDVTEQLFFRIEVQLIKAAVASGNIQVCTTVYFYKSICKNTVNVYNTLQCNTVYYSILQALQYTTEHYSTLQYTICCR